MAVYYNTSLTDINCLSVLQYNSSFDPKLYPWQHRADMATMSYEWCGEHKGTYNIWLSRYMATTEQIYDNTEQIYGQHWADIWQHWADMACNPPTKRSQLAPAAKHFEHRPQKIILQWLSPMPLGVNENKQLKEKLHFTGTEKEGFWYF